MEEDEAPGGGGADVVSSNPPKTRNKPRTNDPKLEGKIKKNPTQKGGGDHNSDYDVGLNNRPAAGGQKKSFHLHD